MMKKAMLVILDGFGNNENENFNAVKSANSPYLDEIFASGDWPVGALKASGLAVGLPDGQMGNSEVGHMNIGAGRVVYQDLTKISKAIETGEFGENVVLKEALAHANNNGGAVHLLGLISDGGVHSHQDHMLGIVRQAKTMGITSLFLHAFMDGRDTSPTEGKGFLEYCINGMEEIGLGKVATISGRYWSMDRDQRWERTKRGYDALVHGVGDKISHDQIGDAFDRAYAAKVSDEFIEPTVIEEKGSPIGSIQSNDTVIFFNFRADRARQMSRALNYTDFPHFDRGIILENLYFATMTRYEAEFPFPVLFPKETLKNVLGEIVSSAGLKQFRIAETEKYAHVTYFLNGGEEKVFAGEERQLVPSPKVATYDLQPEMSADLVTEHLVKTMENKTDIAMYVVNYANCDMVGHTGIMDAAVKAVETVDRNLQKIVETFFATGGDYVLVTADHGNAEQMVDYETGEAFTEHTLNEVPLVLLSRVKGKNLKKQGALCDLAPTMLTLMELEIPKEMTGQSLLV